MVWKGECECLMKSVLRRCDKSDSCARRICRRYYSCHFRCGEYRGGSSYNCGVVGRNIEDDVVIIKSVVGVS